MKASANLVCKEASFASRFMHAQTASVAEVVADYTASVAAGHAPPPMPLYQERAVAQRTCIHSGQPVTDINYELLQLFVQNGVGQVEMMPAALGQLLRPAGYSPEPLDHLLSWHLLTLLKAIGAIITSPATAEKVHTCCASAFAWTVNLMGRGSLALPAGNPKASKQDCKWQSSLQCFIHTEFSRLTVWCGVVWLGTGELIEPCPGGTIGAYRWHESVGSLCCCSAVRSWSAGGSSAQLTMAPCTGVGSRSFSAQLPARAPCCACSAASRSYGRMDGLCWTRF